MQTYSKAKSKLTLFDSEVVKNSIEFVEMFFSDSSLFLLFRAADRSAAKYKKVFCL